MILSTCMDDICLKAIIYLPSCDKKNPPYGGLSFPLIARFLAQAGTFLKGVAVTSQILNSPSLLISVYTHWVNSIFVTSKVYHFSMIM